ncbi:signal transducer and activator of transcription 5B [Homalodisca vitripennis]|nr:signal transducer and activator of transcription 5B [Homalodisca vitripennis]
MALWTKTQNLQGEALQQIRALYGEHFPIEVRHFLAPWIEEKINDINPDNQQHEHFAHNLFTSFLQELETKASTFVTEELFLSKLKLAEAAKMFRQRYCQNPLSLFRIIKHCLDTEMRLIHEGEVMGLGIMPTGVVADITAVEIMQQLELFRSRTQMTSEDLRKLEQEQESFALHYHECNKLNAHLTHLQGSPQNPQNVEAEKRIRKQKEMFDQVLNQKVASLMQLQMALADKLKETVTHLSTLQSRILDDELIRWKRDQQLAGNGAKFNSNLDTIQEWCESLAEIIWLNRQQIKEADRLKQKLGINPPGTPDILPNLSVQVTQLLSSLVTSTFIIEKQPPQVMKTNTRFTSTVRLLVGVKLNVNMNPPVVKVTINSESQANALLKNDKIGKGEASGEILNNTGTMEYHQATRQLSVSFRNMQLKKIKRAEKKGTESVMDEKFSLLFSSQFSIGGGELVFQVWTLSLPVVVIVHGNQEPHAWATVTWDNAFSEPGRVPFAVPEKVSWVQVAEALNIKFTAATGRPLSEDNLRFLAEKAFRAQHTDYNSLSLSWSQFCKEPLPERNFTFWEWFYAVMKLTREHLKGPWMDGLIMGFVRKRQAEEMLSSCASGTFLLRFSDSEPGGVTIAWVGGESSEVFMLQPFTSKDFTIRSLADRISDLPHLVNLYPDICKVTAFSKYYTPFTENQPTSNNGYVKPLLVTHIPGMGGQPGSNINSYPNTPQTMFQPQSPDTASVMSDPVSYPYGPGDMDYNEFMSNLPAFDEVNVDQLPGGLNFFDLMSQYQNSQT